MKPYDYNFDYEETPYGRSKGKHVKGSKNVPQKKKESKLYQPKKKYK